MVFNNTKRGQALAIPVGAARRGGLIVLALFGVFLQVINWRLVFQTSLLIEILAGAAQQ